MDIVPRVFLHPPTKLSHSLRCRQQFQVKCLADIADEMLAQISHDDAMLAPGDEVMNREFVESVKGVLAQDFEVFLVEMGLALAGDVEDVLAHFLVHLT